MKKIKGYVAPYMLGMVAAVMTVSTVTANQAQKQNEQYKQKYLNAKKEHLAKLSDSLRYVYYSDNSADGSVTVAKLTEHALTNAFDLDSDTSINQQGLINGEKLTIIGKNTNKRLRNKLVNLDENNILKEDLSNSLALQFDEKKVRQEQIQQSYKNMKKQKHDIYNRMIKNNFYGFPHSLYSTQHDAWGRDFSYSQIDDLTAELSFNLPWDTSVKKVMKMKIPDFYKYRKPKFVMNALENSFYITRRGDVWVAGRNSYGQLGLGHDDIVRSWTKTELQNIKDIRTSFWKTGIRSYGYNAYAITNNGEVWVAGKANMGALGITTTGNPNIVAGDLVKWTKTSLENIKDVFTDTRGEVAFALTYDGDIWSAGDYSTGLWTKTNLKDILYISFEGMNGVGYALDKHGDVWGLGKNSTAVLGLGDTADVTEWTKLPLSNIKRIEMGVDGLSGYALTNDNKVYVAGSNADGSLGLGADNIIYNWTEVPVPNVKEFSIFGRVYGVDGAFILTLEGDVWYTGRSSYGSFGNGVESETYTTWQKSPIGDTVTNIKEIKILGSAGLFTAMLLTEDNEAWVAGYNGSGQLGLGHNSSQTTWAKLPFSNISKVHGGMCRTTFFISTSDGKFYGAGENSLGQLGLGDNIDQYSWREMPFSSYDIQSFHQSRNGYNCYGSYVFNNNYELWVTGNNEFGQLGLGNTTNQGAWVKSIGTGATEIE